MDKNLNKKVASFKYNNRKYEVDLLLDSIGSGCQSYDIFDMTDSQRCVANFTLEQSSYDSSTIITIAKEEIDEIIN